jgi:hypothetical protein
LRAVHDKLKAGLFPGPPLFAGGGPVALLVALARASN